MENMQERLRKQADRQREIADWMDKRGKQKDRGMEAIVKINGGIAGSGVNEWQVKS